MVAINEYDPEPLEDIDFEVGESIGETFTRWMGKADGCSRCDNLQPPMAVIPAGAWAFRAHYKCQHCGRRWDRTWPDVEAR